MRDKKIKLTCMIPIGDNIKNLRFEAEKDYLVVVNHPHTISVLDKDGYKLNFSKRNNDLNLPHIWDYFDDYNKGKVSASVEKLK